MTNPLSQDPIDQLRAHSKVVVPRELVSEGELREQAWCFIEAGDGWWDVFYYEHGSRTTVLGRAQSRKAALRLLGGRFLQSDILNRAPSADSGE